MAGLAKLREMAKQSRDSEITEVIAELQNQFLELQGSYAQLLQEHEELERAHRELQDATKAKREDFEWRDEVYWRRGTGEGPFCPGCLDGSFKPIRMPNRNGMWICPVCQHKQDTPERLREIRAAWRAQSRDPEPY